MANRLVIAGTHSGSGKTTFTTGLMRALTKRAMTVQPFKCGPDYIDPAFHSFVTGRTCRNLDLWMMGEKNVRNSFANASKGADISIVEGVMGMYDGFGTKIDMGSTAHLSKVLTSPVVLVVDGKGMSSSAAAMVLGYKLLDPNVRLTGVILNNLHGERHYRILKEAIERDTRIRCYGYLNVNKNIQLESRHLGLVPSVEVPDLERKLDEIAAMVEETVDVEGLLSLAATTSPVTGATPLVEDAPANQGLRLAVAKDKAFNFYYEDNLTYLEGLGVDLIPFSPVKDKALPEDIAGIYIGGGFPEVFASELENNVSMREAILEASDKGMPIYAECGGLMYLCDHLVDLKGKTHKMVGVFDGQAEMTKRLQRFGYVEVEATNIPFDGSNVSFRAHEFHRSTVGKVSQPAVYEVKRERDNRPTENWTCGYKKNKTLAAYAHVHFLSAPRLAQSFVGACQAYANPNLENDLV